MENVALVELLVHACAEAKIIVRFEQFHPDHSGEKAGLCRLFGKRTLFVDHALPAEEKIAWMVSALRSVGIVPVFVPKELRRRALRRPVAGPRPLASTRGGVGVRRKDVS